MFCNNCGFKNQDDSVFCSNCGKSINGNTVNDNTTDGNINGFVNNSVNSVSENNMSANDIFANNPSEYINNSGAKTVKKNGSKKIAKIIIAATVAIVAIAAVVVFLVITGNPAYKISKAIQNNDLSAIIKSGSAYDVNYKCTGDSEYNATGKLQIKDGEVIVNDLKGIYNNVEINGKLSTNEEKYMVDEHSTKTNEHGIFYNSNYFSIDSGGQVELLTGQIVDKYTVFTDEYNEDYGIDVQSILVWLFNPNESKGSSKTSSSYVDTINKLFEEEGMDDVKITEEQLETAKKTLIKDISSEKWLKENLGYSKSGNTYLFNITFKAIAKEVVKIIEPIVWQSVKDDYSNENELKAELEEWLGDLVDSYTDFSDVSLKISLTIKGNKFENITVSIPHKINISLDIARSGGAINASFNINVSDYGKYKGTVAINETNEQLGFDFDKYSEEIQECKKQAAKYQSDDYDY